MLQLYRSQLMSMKCQECLMNVNAYLHIEILIVKFELSIGELSTLNENLIGNEG